VGGFDLVALLVGDGWYKTTSAVRRIRPVALVSGRGQWLVWLEITLGGKSKNGA
jgi:hypothetical protein